MLQGTNDGTNWDGLMGNDRWGYRGRKGTYIWEIVKYYTDHYNSTDGIIPTSTSTTVKPKITVPTVTSNTVTSQTTLQEAQQVFMYISTM